MAHLVRGDLDELRVCSRVVMDLSEAACRDKSIIRRILELVELLIKHWW